MKTFFKDIFEYHHHFNQKLIEQLQTHKNEFPERTLPLFSHCLNAHQIWNARITDKEKFGVHEEHTLEKCKHLDRKNYEETLQILEERRLEEKIIYANSKGSEFSNSIQEVLFHIANHFSHHKGQIISDFRQSGIEPIVTDYIFYKR
ncbi:DinB family protein [Mesonia maritima]|uniref:Damage-inducible protein DinB n=1 Tax=Mesonia maritima TaxID=1793873 RepID=A0ABU1K556_9FLAO|nr:DinB family protein [Mesonia maritima]MDR6299642.1 putative damage-inducible protein DinB [Mesonia maritima]